MGIGRLGAQQIAWRGFAAATRASYETDLGAARAFLPSRLPGVPLPASLDRFLAASAALPGRYARAHGGVRTWLDHEFARDDYRVRRAITCLDEAEADALMTVLSVLGHTYRWDSVPPVTDRFEETSIPLPPGLAVPWSLLARRLDLPRVGSAWSLHLTNWRMDDRAGGAAYAPAELRSDALHVAHNWLEPPVAAHLEAFSLSFVLMEAAGAAVLAALVETIESAAAGRPDDVLAGLQRLQSAIAAMTLTFSMHVRRRTVDPALWLELIQPTYAWAAETDRPGKIEGGPSGVQIGTIQALDTTLGVVGRSPLARLARSARRQMPPAHRRFLATLDWSGPVVRRFVIDARCPALADQFDLCVAALGSFRVTHRGRGALYLRSRPAGDSPRGSTGLTIGVDDDPVSTFERSMNERIAETNSSAFLAGRRREASDSPGETDMHAYRPVG